MVHFTNCISVCDVVGYYNPTTDASSGNVHVVIVFISVVSFLPFSFMKRMTL